VTVGDFLFGRHGQPVPVVSVEWQDGSEWVYNFHTRHKSHNYFAGGVLVHNVKPSLQYGGDTGRGGIVRVHPNEWVLSEKMRRGQAAIPPEAMTPAAIQGLITQAVGAGRVQPMQQIQFGPNQIASDMDLEAIAYRVFEIAARKRR